MPFIRPTFIIAILVAIAVHECAHAYAANKLGDPTAERAGRLTLNPLAHLDLVGSIMFLVVGFGWAKPVPVNPLHFRHPKRDMAITAFAGPLSNLIVAAIAFFAIFLLTDGVTPSVGGLFSAPSGTTGMTVLLAILRDSLFVNLALMAFNLFPVAPLDGSSIVRIFIPLRMEERYEDFIRIGPWILLGLIIFESFLPIPLLSGWVFGIMEGVLNVFGFIVSF